jgi:hypothetical protein
MNKIIDYLKSPSIFYGFIIGFCIISWFIIGFCIIPEFTESIVFIVPFLVSILGYLMYIKEKILK